MLKKIIVTVLVTIILASTLIFFNDSVEVQYGYDWQSDDTLFVLVPSLSKNASLTAGWTNAAQEIGLHLAVISDQQFMHLFEQGKKPIAGVILPDIMHLQMNQALFNVLMKYVKQGGQLMFVFDAGTLNDESKPFPGGSPFSKFLGFSYANSGSDPQAHVKLEPVGQTREILQTLRIPPGKCVSASDEKANEIYSATDLFCAISGYHQGPLPYRHFKTVPMSSTQGLLLTTRDHQFIAGSKIVGRGRVLFVNLPLTNLWMATDSMLMHAFLRYFAEDLIQLPILLPVPHGVGGLVLNLHVEDLMALSGFALLKEIGLFQQGPYSIDVTAGPGVKTPDDGKGLDVLHNQNTQNWLRILSDLGHEIGSDGGWLHDYFGIHVNEDNEAEFLPYIKKNNEALEHVLGKRVREYMPSMGNQPNWATRYLERSGFVGYYSAGNTGSAPIRNFRDHVFDAPTLWSFPILPLGRYASIRDFGQYQVPVSVVRTWFEDATRFVIDNRTVRLIYFHPPDVVIFPEYLSAIKSWLHMTADLQQKGRFRWYTMVSIADFLNKRRHVQWTLTRKDGFMTIQAQHPASLSSMTWLIKKTMCGKPEVKEGIANIHDDATNWIIIAGDRPRLLLRCQLLRESQ